MTGIFHTVKSSDVPLIGDPEWDNAHTIEPGTIGLSHLADIPGGTLIGRLGAGTGAASAVAVTDITALVSGASSGYVSVKSYGAVGNGVTDDRSAVASAISAAIAAGTNIVYFPPGSYYLSKYVDLAHQSGLRFWGHQATIVHPSGSAAIPSDATAVSQSQARSAFLLRYCSNITFEGITFIGDETTDILVQLGSGAYATHTVNTTFVGCNQIKGASLVQQDALKATTGTGDILTASGGLVTITDTAGAFQKGHGVGSRFISISNAMNPANNGVWRIVSWTDANTITFSNPNGVTETSSFRWSIDDNDRGLRIFGGRSQGARKNIVPTNDTVIDGHTFEHPDTADLTGIGDSLTISGSTVTLTDHHRKVNVTHNGKYITIAGALSAGNNGVFPIIAVTAKSGNTPASIQFTNASGVTELFSGTWWIANGEKTGAGGASGVFSIEGGAVTADAVADTFTRVGHGYSTGTNVRFGGTARPTGITGIDYYVIKVDNDTFKVATDINRAFQGTAVNFTTNGTAVTVTAGTTLTVTTANSFGAGDLSKNIRIIGATTAANKGTYTVTLATSTSVTYTNWAGVAEAFTGAGCLWTLDGYDRVGGTTSGNGASHAIYCFADRVGVRVSNCAFWNIRTVAVKVSGSSAPISNVVVSNCFFSQCGAAATWGADDSNEHTNLSFVNNTLEDCTMNRSGWSEGSTIGILGSRNVLIANNHFYYSQNNTASVDGVGLGSVNIISCSRYQTGLSQPVDNVMIHGNSFSCDAQQTSPANMMTAPISCVRVGQRAYYDSSGTLTKSGNVMTLTSSAAFFTTQLVGRPITIVNSTGGNDGTFTIESVPSTSTLTFTNAAGTGGSVAVGTYRISPDRSLGTWNNSNHRGGFLRITNNTFDNICNISIQTTGCVAPEISGNEWAFGAYKSTGDLMPTVRGNKSHANNSNGAQIQLNSPCWPIIGNDNFGINANQFSTSIATRGDMPIGIGTAVTDFPLLGTRGRAISSNAQEEIVLAFGYVSDFVDGDTLEVGSTVYTYKASSPTGNQFNSATTLIAAINANTGTTSINADDYGTPFSITSNHIKLRRTVQSTTDGNIYVRATTMNPNCLVILRNDQGGSSSRCASRGCGSAGPTADKVVIWSPLAGFSSMALLAAGNSLGRTALLDGYLQARAITDAGSNAVMTTNTLDPTAEVRWGFAA